MKNKYFHIKKAQIKMKIIDEMKQILENDMSRQEHDSQWVKQKSDKVKQKKTKIIFGPEIKKTEKE